MSTGKDYQARLDAVATCVAVGIPFLLWGEPGTGKTTLVESATDSGFHVETIICSHYEPADFAGLPVVREGRVELAPPVWAVRLAAAPGPALLFLDELTTAAPSVQAAALRTLTHGEVGELTLGPRVSFGAAANPADVAAAGWELAAPTANRFVHLDWVMPTDVYAECLVTGDWPRLSVPDLGPGYPQRLAAQRAMVAAYLRARGSQVCSVPADAATRGRAYPTPRTWDYTARLLAAAPTEPATRRLLVHGAIGAPTGHEFLTWVEALDLPDPETLLADPTAPALQGVRPDRVHAALQGLLAAVTTDPGQGRWTAGMQVCITTSEHCGIDPVVPVVRALLRRRPPAADLPPGITAFAAPLALAGLLPS